MNRNQLVFRKGNRKIKPKKLCAQKNLKQNNNKNDGKEDVEEKKFKEFRWKTNILALGRRNAMYDGVVINVVDAFDDDDGACPLEYIAFILDADASDNVEFDMLDAVPVAVN